MQGLPRSQNWKVLCRNHHSRQRSGGYGGATGNFTLAFSTDANANAISVASTSVQVAENVAGGNVVITLTRVGATKQPTYRVVVSDRLSARDSRSSSPSGL